MGKQVMKIDVLSYTNRWKYKIRHALSTKYPSVTVINGLYSCLLIIKLLH